MKILLWNEKYIQNITMQRRLYHYQNLQFSFPVKFSGISKVTWHPDILYSPSNLIRVKTKFLSLIDFSKTTTILHLPSGLALTLSADSIRDCGVCQQLYKYISSVPPQLTTKLPTQHSISSFWKLKWETISDDLWQKSLTFCTELWSIKILKYFLLILRIIHLHHVVYFYIS